ncbi:sporulation protein YabP [Hathewaya limosa]|uniref:Sporulation protein YabP n=1 Tax=Hathewaya limosa TaxID=1536 RepID=A0ABU0JNC5_HATLI|nr:sporulation protein YabP [Hathewaya limosa]MDQ0478580.1 sporulation protein YabP [Hathewaya limosa]
MESKKEMNVEEKKSNLTLQNRKKLQVSGVQEVISFNEEEIILSTSLGGLNIKGQNLKMNKLDVNNGELNITGTINSCIYRSNKRPEKKDTILSRLFR